jgi:hypothetical protein
METNKEAIIRLQKEIERLQDEIDTIYETCQHVEEKTITRIEGGRKLGRSTCTKCGKHLSTWSE